MKKHVAICANGLPGNYFPSRGMKSASLIFFLVALAALIALALFFILHGVLNADEGFYLAASHLVSQGYRPYHDFGYTQGPLFPYLNLPWLELFGHSLAGQRLAGLSWTIVTVGLGAAWLKRDRSWGSATLFVVLLLGAPVWLAFAVKGKTYAFAGLAVVVGVVAVLSSRPNWLRWLVFVVAAALGAGARLPVAGFFAPGFIGMLMLTPGWRARIGASVFTAGCAAAVLMATAGGDWDRFVFWTMGFHRDSSFYIPVWTHFVDCFRFGPVLWVFAVMTGYAAIKSLSLRAGDGDRSEILAGLPRPAGRACNDNAWMGDAIAQLIVLGSLLIALVVNLSASTTYAEYIFPFIPAVALISAPIAGDLLGRCSLIVRAIILVAAVTVGWNYPPEYSPNVLLHAGQAEAFLRANVPPGSIVACSMPEIPVAAGSRIPLPMAMGKFGITEDFSPALAQDRLMMTPSSLQEILNNPATKALVGSPSYNWNFFWSLPSYRVLSKTAQEEIRATIKTYYRLEFINEEYVVYLRK